jgi:hypothetical protein
MWLVRLWASEFSILFVANCGIDLLPWNVLDHTILQHWSGYPVWFRLACRTKCNGQSETGRFVIQIFKYFIQALKQSILENEAVKVRPTLTAWPWSQAGTSSQPRWLVTLRRLWRSTLPLFLTNGHQRLREFGAQLTATWIRVICAAMSEPDGESWNEVWFVKLLGGRSSGR